MRAESRGDVQHRGNVCLPGVIAADSCTVALRLHINQDKTPAYECVPKPKTPPSRCKGSWGLADVPDCCSRLRDGWVLTTFLRLLSSLPNHWCYVRSPSYNSCQLADLTGLSFPRCLFCTPCVLPRLVDCCCVCVCVFVCRGTSVPDPLRRPSRMSWYTPAQSATSFG